MYAFKAKRHVGQVGGLIERLKHRAYSNALKRRFHVDVFRLGVSPDVLVLHFGGSGVSEANYQSRAHSIIPVFDEALEELEVEELSLVFAFVTAPFDLGFAHFHRNSDEAARWTQHVVEDLLPMAQGLPVFLQGYSGGIELAVRGPQLHPRCVGVGGLGADLVSSDIDTGHALNEDRPMILMMNRHDTVFKGNSMVLDELVECDLAQIRVANGGGHPITDYVQQGAFQGLLRVAVELAARG
jgi:hypothetical protein